MDNKIIKIFEEKLNHLKDLDYLSSMGQTPEAEEIRLIIEYWKNIVVGAFNEKEILLKEVVKEKEEKIEMLNDQLRAIKHEFADLERENLEQKKDIDINNSMREKDRLILEYSIRDKFEEYRTDKGARRTHVPTAMQIRCLIKTETKYEKIEKGGIILWKMKTYYTE